MTTHSVRSFRALVSAQFLGAFNDNFFKQLLLFLAARMLFPGEDKQGIAFAVFALPFVVFSGIAGDLSERFSKRSIIVRMKVAEIAIMGLGALALHLQSWPFMLAVLFVMGLQSAFFGPSKYGVIPEIVPENGLIGANGIIQMTTFMAIVLGQALAGPLLDWFPGQLWIAGACCIGLAVAGMLSARRMDPLPAQLPDLPIPRQPFGSLFSTIGELRRRKGLFRIVLLYSIFWFDGGVIQQAISGLGDPGYLDIGLDENTLLSYLLVTLAVSIMAGCAVVPKVAEKARPGRLVVFGAVGMVAGQFGLLAIGTVIDRAGGAYALAHVLMVVIGFAGAFFVVPLQSYLQSAPPPGMRGKTFAVNNFMNFLFIFLGGVLYLVARNADWGLGWSAAQTQALAGSALLVMLWTSRAAVEKMTIGQGSSAGEVSV